MSFDEYREPIIIRRGFPLALPHRGWPTLREEPRTIGTHTVELPTEGWATRPDPLLEIAKSERQVFTLPVLTYHYVFFASVARPTQKTWLPSLVKPDAVEQVLKAWVAAEGIKVGVHFEE
jgi:hypothetical protein